MGAESGQDELCGSYHSTLVFSHIDSDMHAEFEGQSLKYAWLDLVVGDFG